MIENLLINGCSFSAESDSYAVGPWGRHVARALNITEENYWNYASGGAGNYFISNGTIEALEAHRVDPSKTLVLIMWSGISRKDIRVSKKFFDSIDYYGAKWNIWNHPGAHYVYSGGICNSWLHSTPEIKNCFQDYYLNSDLESIGKDSLDCFRNLTMYLENKGYHYRFMCLHNFWDSKQLLPVDPEFLLDNICKDFPEYKPDLKNWIFTDNSHGGFYEWAQLQNLLGKDQWHPTADAHQHFVTNFLTDKLKELIK